jgi:arabinan endo-1,5-alpha-L-arabinosidase
MNLHKLRAVKFIVLSLVVILLMVVPGSAATWSLSGSLGVHDPGIIKEGNTWYVFYTGQGIQRKTSSNGLAWTQISQVFSSGLSWWKTYVPGNSGNDVWAAEVGYYGGKYWLFYSVSTFGSNTSCIGVASTSGNLGGGWTDNGLVIRSTSSNNYNCIDPSFVVDADNNPWLVFGSFWNGIHLTRLDPATMKPTGSLYNIAKRSGGIEAPNIIYQGGYYYLFVSFDKCCSGTSSTYKIAYGRSTSITGPYTDQNGTNMLSGGGTILLSSSGNIIGPGGQSILNNSVLCYHYYDGNANGASRLRINDLYFANGWPNLTGGTQNTPTPTRAATPTPTVRRNTPTPTRRVAGTATPTRATTVTPTRRAAGTATPTPTRGTGTGNYVVAYTISSDWGSGATINVTLTNNTTSVVNGWTLAWTFPGNQTITNLWNGSYTQSGASVSVKDAGYNATIGANGGTASFGFNLNYSGTNGKPTSFTLNGTACQVQ